MRGAAEQEQRLVQHLLGRLPQAEAERIEERLFTDDKFREELLATADDLIHAYLAGGLGGSDRARFEAHFLVAPRHQERLAYVKDLLSALGRVPASSPAKAPLTARLRAWGFRPAWALSAALVLTVAGGLLWRTVRPAAHEPPAPTPTKPSHAQDEVRLVHLPRRSEGPVSVALGRGTSLVRVEVAVAEGYPSFDAALRRRDGTEVWRMGGLVPAAPGKPLVVDVPARVLADAEYALLIDGEPLRGPAPSPRLVIEYSLRVSRER